MHTTAVAFVRAYAFQSCLPHCFNLLFSSFGAHGSRGDTELFTTFEERLWLCFASPCRCVPGASFCFTPGALQSIPATITIEWWFSHRLQAVAYIRHTPCLGGGHRTQDTGRRGNVTSETRRRYLTLPLSPSTVQKRVGKPRKLMAIYSTLIEHTLLVEILFPPEERKKTPAGLY